jgi:hypothetical protein
MIAIAPGIAILMLGGCLMPQSPNSPDPKFIESLRTDISGIYFSQVVHYTPPQIEDEFRKVVQDAGLAGDEAVMENLLFLVRKRDVRNLREDVSRLVASNRLQPHAQVSGLKTLYALGSENDRNSVDYLVSQALAQLIQSGAPPDSSPYVRAAERIGGPRTLVALRQMYADAANRQRAAEQREPGNQAAISRLDKTRAGLEGKVFTLTRKLEIVGKPEPERAAGLARAYLRRSADLSCWAYRELIERPGPDAAAAVRGVLAREIPALLPASGLSPEDRTKRELDLRLRGVTLLQSMKAALSAEERQLLALHGDMIQSRAAFFYPRCDWEDVLDAV